MSDKRPTYDRRPTLPLPGEELAPMPLSTVEEPLARRHHLVPVGYSTLASGTI